MPNEKKKDTKINQKNYLTLILYKRLRILL
jgi:hypothetical protein